MDELISRADVHPAPLGHIPKDRIRARMSDLGEAVDIVIHHIGYQCLTSRDLISDPRIGGLVFCECGSAGWVEGAEEPEGPSRRHPMRS